VNLDHKDADPDPACHFDAKPAPDLNFTSMLIQIWILVSKPCKGVVPRRLFVAAQQRIAITLSPNYYQNIQRFTTRKNQEEHGPDVM
jgi:hypothetical protein